MQELSRSDLARLSSPLEAWTAERLLEWAAEQFGEKLVVATSFQAEGGVILDMVSRIKPDVRVITVDTGRLHQGTYDLADRFRERYRLDIEVLVPDTQALEQFVAREGVNPFYRSVSLRLECCRIRKVEPLARALEDAKAWVSGLRREQSDSRAGVGKLEIDVLHGGIYKLNPLADWTKEEVWTYIRENDVPYHPLYDAGYRSIGCEPCTRACKPGEDSRAGRWWWESDGGTKECGIHAAHSSDSNEELAS